MLHLSSLVCGLYDQYGKNLCEDIILSEVKSIHPDTASYIELISSTIWLENCRGLYQELLSTQEEIVCSYHSTDESLLSGLAKVMNWPIQTKWNDDIGVKIQSHSGKAYERTLDKDITTLTR